MKARHLALLFACAVVTAAGSAGAQTPPAPKPNPADVIPDQLPFNTPYGAPIGLEQARKLIAAVEADAKRRGWPENVTVVDSAGNLVAFDRMDGAALASIDVSQHKARTAVLYRRETKVWEDAVQHGGIGVLSLDGVIASRGGFPLIENGKVIGAIGCSGGTGSQDAAVCAVGVAMVK
jgi:uncharacterized protein GlcG (DUF336 family)